MKRLSYLILALVLLSSLTLTSTPVKGAAQDWKLWYDIGNGYLQMSTTALSNATQLSIFVIGRPLFPHSHDPLVVLWSSSTSGVWFVIQHPGPSGFYLHLAIGNGSTVNLFPGNGPKVKLGVPGFYGVTWSVETHNATFYYYDPWTKQLARSNVTITANQVGKITTLRIGSSQGYWGTISGDLSANFVFYEVLIYNRTLTPSEVEELYSDPWNPPTAGLLIWFAPWSIQGNTWVNLGSLGGYATMYGSYYILDTQPIPTKSDQAYGINTASGALINQLRVRTMNYTLIFFLRNQIATGRRTIAQVLNPTAFKYDFAINLWNTSQTDVYWGNGTSYVTAAFKYPLVAPHNQVVMLSYVRKVPAFYYNALVSGLTQLYIYKNDELKLSKTLTNDPINWTTLPLQLGGGYAGPANVTFYQVLVYDRPLNESEIRQIYTHPLSPLLSGLEMWFAPWSFNLSSKTWINIAPIWPRLNLSVSNENLVPSNNETPIIYPTSLPNLTLISSSTNQELPLTNASISYTVNNTTIKTLPTLVPIPFNSTATLFINYTGFLPKNFTTTFQDYLPHLVIYLAPAQTIVANFTNTQNISVPEFNVTPALEEMNASSVFNIFSKWVGGQYIVDLLKLNLQQLIWDMFNNPPIPGLGIILAAALWVGVILATWVYFEEPEPVYAAANIMYYSIASFIPFSPQLMFVPVGMFVLFLAAEWFLKFVGMFGRRW